MSDPAERGAGLRKKTRGKGGLAGLLEENRRLRGEIAECERLKKQIDEQNAFVRHVLESLTHPFFVLDAQDYTIKMANSAALAGELPPGVQCYTQTHRRNSPCEGQEHACPLRLVKQTGKPVTMEHVHFDREGSPRYVEVHGYPIFDERGEVTEMLEYTLDITDRVEMERALRQSAEEIERFAYAVSHDLKSPMTGILGLLRLLRKRYGDRLEIDGTALCEQILKAGEQVVVLIDEINAYVRAREGSLAFARISVRELLETVRSEFDAALAERGVAWAEPEALPDVVADRTSLLRIFRNLVDNALRYGGDPLSEIAVGYQDRGTFHVFSVRDDGVAIADADAERIFEAFVRGRTAGRLEGSGLGLAIVRELAAKHGGKVWLESDGRSGVTFFFSLAKDR